MLNQYLLIACICIVIAIIVYLFYLNRLMAFLFGFIIRLSWWNQGGSSIWLEIGDLRLFSRSSRHRADIRHRLNPLLSAERTDSPSRCSVLLKQPDGEDSESADYMEILDSETNRGRGAQPGTYWRGRQCVFPLHHDISERQGSLIHQASNPTECSLVAFSYPFRVSSGFSITEPKHMKISLKTCTQRILAVPRPELQNRILRQMFPQVIVSSL